MTPLYVSEEDRRWERYAAEIIASNGYKVRWPKAPTSRYDFQIWNTINPPRDKVRRWISVEVKRRSFTWGEYPEIFLDMSKVVALVATPPAWFVVIPDDLLPRFTWVIENRMEEYKLDERDVRPERNDPNDKGDSKALIPLILFHPLYDLRKEG